jgi:alkanesulfonate monooxygenase SsuD/methylene tetrahydromethanopterin reductase-like flavin-dependent oxidoreductase (luciferase family)
MRIGINANHTTRAIQRRRVHEHALAAQEAGFSSYWLAEHPVGGFDAPTAIVARHRDVTPGDVE